LIGDGWIRVDDAPSSFGAHPTIHPISKIRSPFSHHRRIAAEPDVDLDIRELHVAQSQIQQHFEAIDGLAALATKPDHRHGWVSLMRRGPGTDRLVHLVGMARGKICRRVPFRHRPVGTTRAN
jgi:hypothetical protein